ncbi:MAG: ATP-binding protein [Promethearchaeota archaeon]
MKDFNQLGNRKKISEQKYIDIPKDIINKWQTIVNLMTKLISVPVGLIMKVDLPFIEVFRSSVSYGNPYKVGDKEHLIDSGLYCETVIKSKDKLLVPNALSDKNWNKNPDIKLGMISYLGFPILFPDGSVFGTICVLDTKENKYNENVEKLMIQFKEFIESHLELLYKNKVILETNKKLKASEEKYRRAYEQVNFYKDLFLHDISNIMQVIDAISSVYSKDIENPIKIDKYMSLIKSNIKKGIQLVFNVRKLSEIEDNVKISLKKIDLNEYLNKAINHIKKSFQNKTISFKLEKNLKNLFVQANELLSDLFENLFTNAAKYNDNEVIEILVKISKIIIEEINYIKIEFIDNGIGIPDERKELIFQKGNRGLKGRKGMGIGLSLVKTLVELYHGKIWVENKVKEDYKKGSNFIILLREG